MSNVMVIEVILRIIGGIIALIGVTMIFDARFLTKKLISFGDQNEGSAGLKITGFVFAIIGAMIIFFNIS